MTRELIEREILKMRKIAKAAAKLFHEKGYLQTNLDDIANAARMSKGGLQYYFSLKHEILYYILKNYMADYMENLKSKLDTIENPLLKLQFMISHHVEFYGTNKFESKLLLVEAHHLPPKYHKNIIEQEIEYYRWVNEILSSILGNEVEKYKLTASAFCLFGMCNWLSHWYKPEGGPCTPSALSEIIYKIFSEGILGLRNVWSPQSSEKTML